MTANLEPGDLVVLSGQGCHQPASELMAIWTVEQVTSTHGIVSFNPDIQITQLPPLTRKRYPLNWLVLYKKAQVDESEEF